MKNKTLQIINKLNLTYFNTKEWKKKLDKNG